MTLFVLRNQQQQWLDKSLNWVDHCPHGQLFKTPHRDVALNQLAELNARDFSLRGVVETLDELPQTNKAPTQLTEMISD